MEAAEKSFGISECQYFSFSSDSSHGLRPSRGILQPEGLAQSPPRTQRNFGMSSIVLCANLPPWTSTRPARAALITLKRPIRDLLRAIPFKPFVIRMADDREYRVEHPYFVLAAASDAPQRLEDLDGCQHYLAALVVTSIERIRPLATDA
jgi:hypothetical protein